MGRIGWVAIGVAGVLAAGCAGQPAGPALATVQRVELGRYMGTWYEIARYPHRFQAGCYGSMATYELRPDGTVDVRNECREGAPDGALRRAQGTARVVDPVTNARLEVSFFRPFWGDYWILDLGADYDYAVVGAPSREYLWILSRTPEMDGALYRRLADRVAQLGFDPGRLVLTPHGAERREKP